MTLQEHLQIDLRVNGRDEHAVVESRTSLADALRHDLGLTGTHVGCEQGVCGSCTVIVDGTAVRSCLILAVQAEGCDVRTVEGLASGSDPENLHPVQAALWERHGLQCGFCTPGVLMAAVAAIDEGLEPEREAVRERMSGVLCRCTGYQSIIDAIVDAAEMARQQSPPKAMD